MTTELPEILDKALAGQLDWNAQANNGSGPPENAEAIEMMVAAAAMVQALPVLPLPLQAQRAADKEAFLMQMELLPAAEISAAAPVGLFAWLSQRLSLPSIQRTQKEPKTMLPLLVKAALVLTILLSSLGGTAVLSASALPGSPGYPVKLLLEEAQLSMTVNPVSQTTLHMAFANERAQEMAGLATQNRVTTQAHLANYQEHWREALRHAGELPDSNLQAMMVQAQTMAGEQQALLEQAQIRGGTQVRSRLQEATQSLDHVQTAVALGLQSQNTYRLRIQDLPEDWPGQEAGFGFGPGDCQGDCEEPGGFAPGPEYGPGNSESPHGPGDADCPDCPNDGEGPVGPGEGDGDGPHGPGIGDCSDDPDGPGDGDCQDDSSGQNGPEQEDDPYESEDDDYLSGPGRDDDDSGNDDSGNDDSGNDDSGNDDSGNDDSGNDDSGNDDSGNDGSGNDDSGNDGSGNDDSGNDDSGNDDSGNDDSDSDDSDKDESESDEDSESDDSDKDESESDDSGDKDKDKDKDKKDD